MNLAHCLFVDIGNSVLKWTLSNDSPVHTLPYQAHEPSALGARLVQSLGTAHATNPPLVEHVIGCCVAQRSLREHITDVLTQRVHPTKIHWLTAQVQQVGSGTPLKNGYRDPLQLGTDRWHAMLGAHAVANGRPFVLVQAGTATTLDGVTADGQHVGGQISPGFVLMRTSLAAGTPLRIAEGTPTAFPNCTADAMARGVLDAQLGAVVQFWQRFTNAYAPANAAPLLICTGGHAQTLAQAWDDAALNIAAHPMILDNLVLRGLKRRAQEFTES